MRFPVGCRCAGFLDFYIDAAMTRPEAAWKDLFTMGYDRSLKRAVVRASIPA